MAFKSKAQARKFFAMEKRGEISKATLDEFKEATPSIKALPERVAQRRPKTRLKPRSQTRRKGKGRKKKARSEKQ